MPQVWTYHSLRHDHTRTESLELQWEVIGDPISDSYTPSEISAHELFDAWGRKYGSDNDGLLSIYWLVSPVGEAAPLQGPPFDDMNFHMYWSDPVDAETGESINWMTLPVIDKKWNLEEGDKGGFIQEATGWKPSPLQPYVSYASLAAAVSSRQRNEI